MNIKKQISLLVCLLTLQGLNSARASADWRPDYKAMIQANDVADYDKSAEYAKNALDKLIAGGDPTEIKVGIEQIIQQLRQLNSRYKRQMNYPQQEVVLKSLLKAQQAKSDEVYQIAQTKKDLALCLVLEGKTKEAQAYTNTTKDSTDDQTSSKIAWKNDLDLLTQASKTDDRESICKYGTNAVDDALSVKNATEREVAFTQILQQLQTAQYKFKDKNKDYAGEEKVLKSILKIEQAQEAEKTTDGPAGLFGLGGYQSMSTLKQLVTCLVMQGKDDEAATYDAQYKEMNKKMTKTAQEFQKNLTDQLSKAQETKNKDSNTQ